jgi:hypothetical protein
MVRMNNTKRLAASFLLGLLAAAASAQNSNGNNGNHFGSGNGNSNNNGNHFGSDTGSVIALPEPAVLGLFGAGAAALGLAVLLRRRKH